MHINNNVYYRICFTFAVLILLDGCKKGPPIVPISGKITIDGKALTTGMITVYQKKFRPATAMIEKDGSFTFKTIQNGDGCLLGEHPITVFSNRNVGETKSEHFIPEEYGNIDRSNAKIKIDGPNADLKINLTWRGSNHSGPYISGN